MRTVKEVAAAVATILRDVAQHATVLGTHRAELNELRAEIAALKARGPAVRTPGRVTEPASPVGDDSDAACIDAREAADAALRAAQLARRPGRVAEPASPVGERYPLRDRLGRPYRVQQINGRSIRCFAPEA